MTSAYSKSQRICYGRKLYINISQTIRQRVVVLPLTKNENQQFDSRDLSHTLNDNQQIPVLEIRVLRENKWFCPD